MKAALGRKLRNVRQQSELDAVLDAGEIPRIVDHGLFVVSGGVTVYATSGIVDAHGCARVIARASAAVRAQDRAHVWSEGCVHVDAYDRATVVATGRSHVRAAGESRVFAGQRALITLVDGAEAVCGGEVTVHATGHARVQALGHARVVADGGAVVRAAPAVSVHARGTAQVWAHRDVCVLIQGSGVTVHRVREVDAATHGLPPPLPTDHRPSDTELSPNAELVQAELGRPGF